MKRPRWLEAGEWGRATLLAVGVLILTALLAKGGRIDQPDGYHDFADQRWPDGFEHCLNVLSNLPFAVVGWFALKLTWPPLRSSRSFVDFLDAFPGFAFALGVALTAAGSSYYHLDPNDPRLVWDRIPMTFAFMGLSALVLDQYFAPGTRRILVLPLLAIGVGSVLFWHPGGGGLGPYVLVQVLPLLVVAVVLLVAWREQRGLGIALLLYGVAKLCETCDHCVYEALGELVSGHTLKHLAAAGASFAVIPSLREPPSDPSRSSPPSDREAAPLPPP